LGLLTLLVRAPFPSSAEVARAPWWLWTGGILGSFYIVTTIVALPRLGGALTFALIVAGQMFVALLIDQIGLFGIDKTPLSATRVAGAVMLVAAVVLIRK
jgi:transporter family-2 protein